MSGQGVAILVSVLLTGIIMVAWIVWGVREYRRTGSPQWLWMAALLSVSILVMLSTYLAR